MSDTKKSINSQQELESGLAKALSKLISNKELKKGDLAEYTDEAVQDIISLISMVVKGFLFSSNKEQKEIIERSIKATKTKVPDMLDTLVDRLIENPNLLEEEGIDTPDEIKELLDLAVEAKKKQKEKEEESIEEEIEEYEKLAEFDESKYKN